MGIRLSYDAARVAAPGTYTVDPLPEGGIELYCIRPEDGFKDSDVAPPALSIEAEVNFASITFDAVPIPGDSRVAGYFRDVRLERAGAPVLTLSEGTFETTVP